MKNLTTIITAIFLLTSITTAQNYSLSFDGNDDYVNVGNTSSLTISGDITVSAWVYFDDFNTTLPNVISKITDGSNVSYGIEKKSQQDKLSFWIGDGTDFVDAISGVLSATTWYHVVGTNDGTNSKIYINGALAGTAAQGNPAGPTGDLKIGLCSTQSQSYRYWDGLIDEVAIWNDALTADEITALYNSGNGLDASSNSGNYSSSSNLQGYWKFNEGSGTTLTDQTSNGNNGTISGATWSTDTPGFVTYYVATDGSDDNDGSENSPFATIQAGIDAASSGDTVLVEAGTYVENINYNGKNIALIGEDRETTIIDGNEDGSVVTFENGETTGSKLIGFTIQNGAAFGEGSDNYGGGIICEFSSPILDNLIIEDNRAGWGAGGIYFNTSSGELSNSIIRNNRAGAQGGGAYISSTSVDVLFNNVEITQNTVTDSLCCGSGAAVHIHYYSSAKFTNVTIANNTA